MPRLFTAIEVPAEVGSRLALMRGGMSGATWIDVENYHLTLRFIGDIDHARAGDVFAILDQIRHRALSVVIDGLHSFGGDKPRALVARAQQGAALMELQAAQEKLMRRIGLPGEPRKFAPHVTLARLRGASNLAVADYLGARGYFPPISFEARRFVVFSSRDSTGGGPYRIEESYPLIDTAISAPAEWPRQAGSPNR